MDHATRLGQERRQLQSPVDALSRLYFLFADPIEHVRAPVVWSALLHRNGINAVMLPAHTAPAGLDTAVAGAKQLRNIDGLMFTMPFKVAAMRHADRLTPRAQRAGSINLLRPESDGSWTGDNVDGAGFLAGLGHDGVRLEGAHVYLHGCGGVGQNLAWTLGAEPVASLTLFDIEPTRAGQLAERMRAQCTVDVQVGTLDVGACDLAINASPLGLHGDDPLPFDVSGLAPHAVVADVIMEPVDTALLQAARARGLKTHHGRHMMDHALPLAADFYRLPAQACWRLEPTPAV